DVTALFWIWSVPTLLRGTTTLMAAIPVPLSATSSASPATTIEGDGFLSLRSRFMGWESPPLAGSDDGCNPICSPPASGLPRTRVELSVNRNYVLLRGHLGERG